eukprot:5910056-Pyramimonas_sp.AAC.1
MCWKNHNIDLIRSYPSIPPTEQLQYDTGRYLPSVSNGIGCYLTYHSYFRLGSGAGRTLVGQLLLFLSSRYPARSS